ncbi:hypothetical protein HPP92_028329 [Vanilla planifolia]|uniref:Pentatricopeptide repeat-containing protein n=1 Tax=Vanilla planifolia TaxID=51239 RepID=A0A835P852_VANPL|nr:hypothetical protein HPP92_028329 [Vanilla planifolia]KAG0447497.1 hypothetical protein HPP92_028303 [Vanilla planifolia]
MLGFIRTNSRCLHPIHITCLSFLHSGSTTAASGTATFPVCFLPPSRPRLPIDELETSYIVSSFSDWFRRGSDPIPLLLDQIYSAFAFSADGSALNSSLSRLRLRLSEDFVLRFLRHRPHPSVVPNASDVSNSLLQLRIRFFDWCIHQPCYFHTRTVYHALFRLLYRHNHVSFVMDCLKRFSEFGRFSLFPGVATVDAMKGHSRFYYTLVIGYSINARGFSGPVTDCIRMKSLCCQGRLDDAALFLRQLYLRNHREVADRSVVTLVQALCKAGRIECARHFVE